MEIVLKRWMALLLALMMLTACLPLAAMAQEPESGETAVAEATEPAQELPEQETGAAQIPETQPQVPEETILPEETANTEPEELVLTEGEAATEDAQLAVTSGSWTYNVSGGKASIVSYNGTASSVMVPTSVRIDGITYQISQIGDSAFEDNIYLKSVTLPKSITQLGRCAFKNCINLSSVTINGDLADQSSSSIYSSSSSYSTFYNAGTNTTGMTVTFGSSVTRIPAYLFATGEEKSSTVYAKVTKVILSGSVKEIGSYAFWNCYRQYVMTSHL